MDVSELDDFARRHIHYKAKQLIGREGFTRSDVEDLEQELAVDLLGRLRRFDPNRASRETFTVHVVRHRIATIIRDRKAGIRDYRREECSLNQTVRDENGALMERGGLVDEQAVHVGRTDRERCELRSDMEAILNGMSEEDRDLCVHLMKHSPSEVAQQTGISRPTIYERLEKFAPLFEKGELRDYL